MLMRRSRRVRPARNGGHEARTNGSTAKPRANGNGSRYQWTIMVYLAGDNNLSDEMIWALKEVYRVGTPENVAVTLQFDPLAERRLTRFYQVPTTENALDIDGIFPILHDEAFPESSSGDPATLVDFVKRSVTIAPADRYMLILSGHGSGVVGGFLADQSEGRKRSLDLPDLRKVFELLRSDEQFSERARRPMFDVLGMDTCLMSMIETCSEIAGHVSFLVGSEGFDPNTGWPYYRLLEDMRGRTTNGTLEPAMLVKALVRQYVLYYADFPDADISVDISACAVDKKPIEKLEDRIRAFVDFYLDAGADNDALIHRLVVLAHWRAQTYKLEQYTDLRDFFDLLRSECTAWVKADANLKTCADLCKKITDAIDAVVRERDTAGPRFQYSNGLSVFFPWSPRMLHDSYRCTAFAQRAKWGEFLSRHVTATQRPIRDRVELRRAARTTGGLGLVVSDHGARLASVAAARSAKARQGEGVTTDAAGNGAAATEKRFNMPADRFNMPADRFNMPADRFNMPADRFAHEVDTMFKELPSSMKNMPFTAQPVLRFSQDQINALRKLKAGKRRAQTTGAHRGGKE